MDPAVEFVSVDGEEHFRFDLRESVGDARHSEIGIDGLDQIAPTEAVASSAATVCGMWGRTAATGSPGHADLAQVCRERGSSDLELAPGPGLFGCGLSESDHRRVIWSRSRAAQQILRIVQCWRRRTIRHQACVRTRGSMSAVELASTWK